MNWKFATEDIRIIKTNTDSKIEAYEWLRNLFEHSAFWLSVIKGRKSKNCQNLQMLISWKQKQTTEEYFWTFKLRIVPPKRKIVETKSIKLFRMNALFETYKVNKTICLSSFTILISLNLDFYHPSLSCILNQTPCLNYVLKYWKRNHRQNHRF